MAKVEKTQVTEELQQQVMGFLILAMENLVIVVFIINSKDKLCRTYWTQGYSYCW